ncbi:hypothetical protein Poly41_56220 [Novipirellula artificiosorum]|uniref:Uncharacterized protein n=1 Tax=Novipirellula artificiosorum TaxID=2528016 RepID=A0A5C6DA09_9BACT|nr:hypothetical protein Poly41_56220 [Novipirellula artificiosorum]
MDHTSTVRVSHCLTYVLKNPQELTSVPRIDLFTKLDRNKLGSLFLRFSCLIGVVAGESFCMNGSVVPLALSPTLAQEAKSHE